MRRDLPARLDEWEARPLSSVLLGEFSRTSRRHQMADLTNIEKLKLERLLEMASGYVLDFSNRTFQEFVLGSVGVDIYDSKYDHASGSKANRLRAFWSTEPNHLVAKLLADLLEYIEVANLLRSEQTNHSDAPVFEECARIVTRLREGGTVAEAEAIRPYSPTRTFSMLAVSIQESIRKNEPELALDRLHTFTVKYIRHLCDRRGITYDRGIPLHSLFGRYVKHLRDHGLIESEMTERILKSSISILEAFNKVRNDQSFAHDNPLLSHSEALLIFNNIAASIKFLEALEKDAFQLPETDENGSEGDVIPF